MAISWNDNLVTGVSEIDRQHQEIFQSINQLLNACNQGKGKNEIGKVIKFMEDYASTHFAMEEKYMARYDYPEAPAHQAEHLQFTNNFSLLKELFEKKGERVQVVIMTNRLVVDWLINHILKLDMALAVFLKTKV